MKWQFILKPPQANFNKMNKTRKKGKGGGRKKRLPWHNWKPKHKSGTVGSLLTGPWAWDFSLLLPSCVAAEYVAYLGIETRPCQISQSCQRQSSGSETCQPHWRGTSLTLSTTGIADPIVTSLRKTPNIKYTWIKYSSKCCSVWFPMRNIPPRASFSIMSSWESSIPPDDWVAQLRGVHWLNETGSAAKCANKITLGHRGQSQRPQTPHTKTENKTGWRKKKGQEVGHHLSGCVYMLQILGFLLLLLTHNRQGMWHTNWVKSGPAVTLNVILCLEGVPGGVYQWLL